MGLRRRSPGPIPGGPGPTLHLVGRRVQIALAAAVGALLLLAVGAYALDRANSDEIADGVRVGDVEVGGLSPSRHAGGSTPGWQAARDARHGDLRGHRVQAQPRAARAARGRRGHGRRGARREPLGRPSHAGLALRNRRLGRSRDRSPARLLGGRAGRLPQRRRRADRSSRSRRDGQPDARLAQRRARPGRRHRSCRRPALPSAVGDREPPGHRSVSAPVDRVKPEVTSDELAQEYPAYITIDRATFQLRLWKNLKLAKHLHDRGRRGRLETPAGVYHDREQAGQPDLVRARLSLGR